MESTVRKKTQAAGKAVSRRASREEIVEAFLNLTNAEKVKLSRQALFLSETWEILANDEEDLLQTALQETLGGPRHWYIETNPTLVEHLTYALINAAGKIRRKLMFKDERTGSLVRRMDGTERADGTEIWDDIANSTTGTEAAYAAVETVNLILRELKSDKQAIQVIGEWNSGYTGTEIIKRLGLTKTQYATITRRIDRKLIKFSGGSSRGVK